ncbi:DUF429 domain-containing protein [Vampirovibrio sp.]|uniref:DUF429 domain-containing protein n=1 Tax=Vampirovibrio sp. TaxID=2717857 RepID=UPI0035945D42
MRIYGLDFTSAPTPKKPITVACCDFTLNQLILRDLLELTDFNQFEAFLNRSGPWLAAMDFPLSLPHSWLQAMAWPTAWADSVSWVHQLSMQKFCQHITTYAQGKPAGQKHHFRPIDRIAGACSPMTIHYTPVGRMFYQGAHRLLNAGVYVLPFMSHQPLDLSRDRIVVEGYPALIARQLCPGQGYKYEKTAKASAAQSSAKDFARQEMIQKLAADLLMDDFGFSVDLNGFQQALYEDSSGDRLDAFLCAMQAAWAYTQRDNHFGIPQAQEAEQGWITAPPYLFRKSFLSAPEA